MSDSDDAPKASEPRRIDPSARSDGIPTLYLVATPIGNLEDITARALRILGEVDTIACEDTRKTRGLLTHFGITGKRLIACHDHNERASAGGIVGLLQRGQSVALCSDAGMPVVNDPGYRVIKAVLDAGYEVSVIPGPSAVLSALVLSNLPPDKFVFLGFAPRKPGQRKNWLIAAAHHRCTMVLMEAPHRLPDLLRDALDVYGDIQASVSLEITKMYEQTVRGPLSDLVERFAEAPKGEIMVVFDGAALPKT
jgi:16S rRNA (cytidine1402-2'-O)-methyltransferase